MSEAKYWVGTPPAKCQICELPLTKRFHRFHDARVKAFNCWANICDGCHEVYGFGHGTGIGQQYEVQPDGRWLKTKG